MRANHSFGCFIEQCHGGNCDRHGFNMSDSCEGSCGSCSENCNSRKPTREEMLEPANSYSSIKKIIGVVSGKGGVGKSFVTSWLSVLMNRKGYKTAILDADMTGPSIPKAFGIHKKVTANEMGIFPGHSEQGTKVMSVNLLLDSEETPVIWRGPVIAGTVKQFWSEVVWGTVDYMFVDMPPGTGDVPLTIFQSVPLDGIIIVTSPQELVSMIVAKALNMAEAMEIPILGVIENYSYVICDSCGEKMHVFGESHLDQVAEKFKLKILGKLPLDPAIAKAVDQERIESLNGGWLDEAVAYLEQICPVKESGNKGKLNDFRKIAVSVDENGVVTEHFGKSTRFFIYELDRDILLSKSELSIEGEGHIVRSERLRENGIQVLICGGIGPDALNLLLQGNIMVIPGQSGDSDVAVASYADGSLLGAGGSCADNGCDGCSHSCQ